MEEDYITWIDYHIIMHAMHYEKDLRMTNEGEGLVYYMPDSYIVEKYLLYRIHRARFVYLEMIRENSIN